MSDVPNSSAVGDTLMHKAYHEGSIPLQHHFDRFSTPLIPDGANTGSDAPEAIRKDWVAAYNLFIRFPHNIWAKLAVRESHVRLRDSRYSRLGRTALHDVACKQAHHIDNKKVQSIARHIHKDLPHKLAQEGPDVMMETLF